MVAGLKFDLSKITALQMAEFNQAAKTSDMPVIAKIFTLVVVECPFGDPKDPATFLSLPFFGAWHDVLTDLVEASKKAVAPPNAPS